MGIFWDLLQQDEIDKQQEQANSVEERIKLLEEDLANIKVLLKKTLYCFRNTFGKRYRW